MSNKCLILSRHSRNINFLSVTAEELKMVLSCLPKLHILQLKQVQRRELRLPVAPGTKVCSPLSPHPQFHGTKGHNWTLNTRMFSEVNGPLSRSIPLYYQWQVPGSSDENLPTIPIPPCPLKPLT